MSRDSSVHETPSVVQPEKPRYWWKMIRNDDDTETIRDCGVSGSQVTGCPEGSEWNWYKDGFGIFLNGNNVNTAYVDLSGQAIRPVVSMAVHSHLLPESAFTNSSQVAIFCI